MIEAGDLVLCTVDRIEGTVVFVKMQDSGKELEGSIVVSEIAPGRIRNLRDYVVPKKRIVCKVLRITPRNIELSLRRVTQKERKEVLEKDKQEKSYISILKTTLGDRYESVLKEITEKQSISDLFQEARENPKEFEKILGKKDSEKILEILQTQKQRHTEIKKEIRLSTINPDGIELIKEALGNVKNAEVKYISAGKYSIKTQSSEPKKAGNYLKEILLEIEKFAKKRDMEFSVAN